MSLFNENTVAAFQSENDNFCVEYQNLSDLNNRTKKECFNFKEKISVVTAFEHDKIKYFVARSEIDNATLFYINNKVEMIIYTYGFEDIRYNVFTQKLFEYQNLEMKEYDTDNFMNAIIRLKHPVPLRSIKTPLIEDYSFWNNDSFLFLKDTKVYAMLFANISKPLLISNGQCLPFQTLTQKIMAFRLLCFLSLLTLFAFVFGGYKIKRGLRKPDESRLRFL